MDFAFLIIFSAFISCYANGLDAPAHLNGAPVQSSIQELENLKKISSSGKTGQELSPTRDGSRRRSRCSDPNMTIKLLEMLLEFIKDASKSEKLNVLLNQLEFFFSEVPQYQERDSIYQKLRIIEEQLLQINKNSGDGNIDDDSVYNPNYQTSVVIEHVPSVSNPQCKEEFSKVLQTAFNAYREIENFPNCQPLNVFPHWTQYFKNIYGETQKPFHFKIVTNYAVPSKNSGGYDVVSPLIPSMNRPYIKPSLFYNPNGGQINLQNWQSFPESTEYSNGNSYPNQYNGYSQIDIDNLDINADRADKTPMPLNLNDNPNIIFNTVNPSDSKIYKDKIFDITSSIEPGIDTIEFDPPKDNMALDVSKYASSIKKDPSDDIFEALPAESGNLNIQSGSSSDIDLGDLLNQLNNLQTNKKVPFEQDFGYYNPNVVNANPQLINSDENFGFNKQNVGLNAQNFENDNQNLGLNNLNLGYNNQNLGHNNKYPLQNLKNPWNRNKNLHFISQLQNKVPKTDNENFMFNEANLNVIPSDTGNIYSLPDTSKYVSFQDGDNWDHNPQGMKFQLNPYQNMYANNYGKHVENTNVSPDFLHLVTEANLNKLNLSPNKSDLVELTYVLQKPKPVIYQPFYYVKYRLPYKTFLSNYLNIISKKPKLRKKPQELYREILSMSNITNVSPSLRSYKKDDIINLIFNKGSLVDAKVLNGKDDILNEQLEIIRNLNSDITPEDILDKTKLVDNATSEAPKIQMTDQVVQESTVKATETSKNYPHFDIRSEFDATFPTKPPINQ